MKINKKEEAFICAIFVLIGIALSVADLFTANDFAWKVYAFFTGGCTLSLHLVRKFETKRKKIFCAVAVAVCQSLVIAEFLTGLFAVKITVIVASIFTATVFAWFLRNVHTKTVCSKEAFRDFSERHNILKYNFLSNSVCVCGVSAMAYNVVQNVFIYILICALMVTLTLARQFYSKRYFTKKPIAYISEMAFIIIGFCAVTLVAWVREIPQSGLGFTFIYLMFLTAVYLIFDRPYVDEIILAEFKDSSM